MFANREEAGRVLARSLHHLESEDVVVLGLPRGGVPVAYQVADALGAPLDVIVVRKLGAPFQPELALGAIGEGGARVVDEGLVRRMGVGAATLSRIEARERAELEERLERLRRGRPRIPLEGRVVLIVDDGIATGSTARAAARVARALGAARVVVATPVAPPDVAERLADDADDVIVVDSPPSFFAIGQFYADFSPTTDREVRELLDRARVTPAGGGADG